MTEFSSQNGNRRLRSITVGCEHIDLTQNEEDFPIQGWGILELNPDANNWEVGGVTITDDELDEGRDLNIYNMSATHNIIIKHNSAGSLEANRFMLDADVDYVLRPKKGIAFKYMQDRWVQFG